MTIKQLVRLAMEENKCSEIEAVSSLQAAAAISGNTKLLDRLCEYKNQIIGKLQK